MMRTIRIVPTVILATAVLLTAGNARAFTRDPAPVFVNELHYDNTGADQNEAVEIAGPAETDLTGWRLVLYSGTMAQTTSPKSYRASSRTRAAASVPS